MTAIRPARSHPAPLTEMVAGLGLSGPIDSTALIRDITLDSRDAAPGTLWVALPGSRGHGASHAASAVAADVTAILTDEAGAALLAGVDVPVLVSGALRRDMGVVASRVFGHPADRMMTLGVTGTNGKTTTVALLEAALAGAGHTVGTIGTIGFRLAGQELPSARGTVTTPESPDLQALLAVMGERGADAVALEVSSHAMVLERATGMVMDVAGFLNLGRDHLDFHGDMDSYFEAKARLFTAAHTRAAVCWVDDPHGSRIAERARLSGLPVTTVGTGDDVDFRLSGWEPVDPLGGRAVISHDGRDLGITISMPGLHNMVDALMALAMAHTVGVPPEVAVEGLRFAQVPGRMQLLDLPHGAPTVVVDFAHTPQAVAASLDALASSFSNVITVLGCGGDRDREKRPLMGRAAAERSDLLVVTDDNPRTEDAASIRRAMLEGACDARADVVEVPGRKFAIEHALAAASAGSVVAILGKGHERGQQIGHEVLEFDDAVEARRAWGRNLEGHP
ncbi:UDP-N-acetylmuramoyl-L-alanyl-D-glutamate--2,6-diaminopimelate ligase [Tessaracoccus antarcticus]|uniref:UDP-N-acetylmuramoyl-L-alanyl-D-glutamate--2,6-diaminopimelate ligase n=2 Tax=Tessaracoccus antarcticus TaxID=2479848 RepID=A0A3M0G3Y7_9ACTN|nr:UDP-N-acetylmuramoyl-L-alanyl-D-glutamate--2,6-diaminopimelate ligase [Tessaracoccus antarcticus]RMB59690.1 UDP-N-acetylmuramoyl-L-alanyl-D-glutamate--2,6-diaminopimelate ligase [Tessaracoccus antarcticus]